ncbi:MAG: hypothetical protein AAFX96_10935, partial [Pseudomonadota bacterium]
VDDFTVFGDLAPALTKLIFLLSYRVSSKNTKEKINFVKAGARSPKTVKSSTSGLLHLAPDWKVLCDLETKLVVPPFLAVTRLCPNRQHQVSR